MIPRVYIQLFLVLFTGILLNSCSLINQEKTDNKDTAQTSQLKRKTINVFYSLPSPLEMNSIIQKTGVKYNDEFLNPVDNVTKYNTNMKMALNLGVYGADLSYASLFDQRQTSLLYMGVVKKLADGLGILSAIKQDELKKLEENIHNKEVMMEVISETFFSSDAYLKENDRPEIATIVVVGGWVESLYIAMQLSEKSISINKELVDRIMDQRLSLENLLNLLGSYDGNTDLEALKKQMTEINTIYNKMITTVEVESINKETGKTVKTVKTSHNITPELFIELYNKIGSIRNEYIN